MFVLFGGRNNSDSSSSSSQSSQRAGNESAVTQESASAENTAKEESSGTKDSAGSKSSAGTDNSAGSNGSAEAKEPAEAEKPAEAAGKEQAHDFDEQTNRRVKVDYFVVQVPANWEEDGNLGYYAERGGGSAFFQIVLFNLSPTDSVEEIIESFVSGVGEGLDNYQSSEIEYYSHEPTDMTYAIVSVSGVPSDYPDLKLQGYLTFLIDEDNNNLLSLSYLESTNTVKSHTDDYFEVLKSVRIDDTVPEDDSEEETEELLESGMRPEIKEAIDDYEEFMDQYIVFMESYDASDTSMLMEYANLMTKYSEVTESMEALEEDLNDAELAYYTEVSLRVSQKLLEASKNMGN